MLFRKRQEADSKSSTSPYTEGEEVVEGAKASHGRFTIVPRTKQLMNGKWIARITLEEETDVGVRSYDFAGPMSEFATRDEAVRVGVEHAKQRLDHVP